MDRMKPRMLTAEEVMERLSVSRTTAYQVMREVNEELERKGIRTRAGRVSQSHFDEIYFGIKGGDES